MSNKTLRDLIISLYKIDGLKFGSFTLKSGLISPVYFDLRVIISYPEVMKLVSDIVGEELKGFKFDVICGIPYTALPIASLISVQHGVPMLIKRKEQKEYGTGKLIEGNYSTGTRCLLIEDVITSGSSVVETADACRQNGLIVEDAIIILDRGQGALVNLKNNGITTKALITMNTMLNVLLEENLITSEQNSQVVKFLQENQLFDEEFEAMLKFNLISRISNPISLQLVKLMSKKKSNLCLSADLENWEEVLQAAELLGPKICVLKTHVDTLNLKGYRIITEFWKKLKAIANKHEFLILEDRKFADIGSTVQKQLESKPFEISKWADMITVHGISGPGVLKAIGQLNKNLGVILIAEMSSEGNLCSDEYKKHIFEIAEGYQNLVSGFVSQSSCSSINKGNYFLQYTPGVALEKGQAGDGLGQQYCSVEEAILQRNADVIIVGRGILKKNKEEWLVTAEDYRKRGWEAFKRRWETAYFAG